MFLRSEKPDGWKTKTNKRRKKLQAIPIRKKSSLSGLTKRVGERKEVLLAASKIDVEEAMSNVADYSMGSKMNMFYIVHFMCKWVHVLCCFNNVSIK